MTEFTAIRYIPTLVKSPRKGWIGKILDNAIGVRYVGNTHAYAGYYVATRDNKEYYSRDRRRWSPALYASIVTGKPRLSGNILVNALRAAATEHQE